MLAPKACYFSVATVHFAAVKYCTRQEGKLFFILSSRYFTAVSLCAETICCLIVVLVCYDDKTMPGVVPSLIPATRRRRGWVPNARRPIALLVLHFGLAPGSTTAGNYCAASLLSWRFCIYLLAHQSIKAASKLHFLRLNFIQSYTSASRSKYTQQDFGPSGKCLTCTFTAKHHVHPSCLFLPLQHILSSTPRTAEGEVALQERLSEGVVKALENLREAGATGTLLRLIFVCVLSTAGI